MLLEQLEKNKERYLEELIDLLRIPSVSADPKYKKAVFEAAQYIEEKLRSAGADNVRIIQTEGYPVVYGEKVIDKSKPVVLVYGHYDVQPPDPLDLWKSPPFEPMIRNEKIYARGACDDKGQLYIHIKAFEIMMNEGSLPCNVKFMFEGEEEVGSEHLESFVNKHREMLKADVVLVSDSSMLANETPSITTGLRGLAYMQLTVTGPNRDLHSGVYGGAVDNPVNVLCNIISSLHDEDGRITIEGFYDKVEEVSDEERSQMKRAPFDLNKYKNDLNIEEVAGEKGYTTLERTTIRPSLDVNGIWGGYTREGAKTVLPSKAHAKISMRLVPNQHSSEIASLFSKHIQKIAPPSVKVEVVEMHGGEAVLTPTDSIAYKAASKAVEKTYGKLPVPLRNGGSIPIVAMFERILGIKTVLLGFGLDSDAIHSPNEHFGLFNFYKGIETIPYFYKYYSEMFNSEQ